jgi:Family of unknown function (DUF6527)
MSNLPRPLTDPWFEAEFYGGVFENRPCSETDPSCCHSVNHLTSGYKRQGGSIEGAQGIFLYCPCSFGVDKGAHGLLIPFSNPRNAPNVPEGHGPQSRDGKRRPRWTMSGTGLADLSLAPSVAVGGPECWHGFITTGIVK